MKKMAKLLLLLVVAGSGAVAADLYLHRRYTLQSLPPATSSDDSDDLRYKLRTKLSAAKKQQLFDGDCQLVNSIDALPQPIKNAFATVTQDEPFALANPRTRFNATDVIESGLPRRRLLFAGVCSNRWIIQYEKGGLGLSVDVIVFSIESNGDVHFIWGGQGFTPPAANLTALRDGVVSGKFHDADRF